MTRYSVLLALAFAFAFAVANPGSAQAAAPMPWSDTPVTRLEALALIESLNAELLSSNSATLTLEKWCREHALGDPPQILAHRIDTTAQPASAEVRSDLNVDSNDAVRYRRVELTCGAHVLSVAENWYVPARLTPEMNRLLDSTLTPFGKVVLSLQPHRETLAAHLMWSPLPDGWEVAAPPPPPASTSILEIPAALFEHRAVLYTPARLPIAEVHEVYQRDLLDFPEPKVADRSPH